MTAAIETDALRRRFGDKLAVDGVDLDDRAGRDLRLPRAQRRREVDDGARCCARCSSPPAARPSWPAHDVAPQPDAVRLRIGVALQDAALDDKQTGRELLRLQGRLYGLRRERDRSTGCDELAQLVDIGDALDDRIGTYSGGMKRRLDLAAALVHNPDVLFLDEPTTGLDPISRAKVWDEVRRLNERARHDDLPHHAVPGGGRSARPPGRHHQRRQDRGRGDARRAQAPGRRATSSWCEVDGDRRARQGRAARLDGDRLGHRQRPRDRWPTRADGAAAVSPVAVALAEAEITGEQPSRCARPRSTTCSSSSPATASRRRDAMTAADVHHRRHRRARHRRPRSAPARPASGPISSRWPAGPCAGCRASPRRSIPALDRARSSSTS